MTPTLHHRIRRQAFTLVELLFTMAVASVILVGVTTTYIFSLRGFRGLSNYNEMQGEGRQSLDWFSRDVRAGMAVGSCTSNTVVVLLPKTVNSSGVVTSTNAVTHTVTGGTWTRTDGTGKVKQLATSVTSMQFSIYDQAGNVTTQVSQAVSVQVDTFLAKKVQKAKQSSEFLSARYRMRNTP